MVGTDGHTTQGTTITYGPNGSSVKNYQPGQQGNLIATNGNETKCDICSDIYGLIIVWGVRIKLLSELDQVPYHVIMKSLE